MVGTRGSMPHYRNEFNVGDSSGICSRMDQGQVPLGAPGCAFVFAFLFSQGTLALGFQAEQSYFSTKKRFCQYYVNVNVFGYTFFPFGKYFD